MHYQLQQRLQEQQEKSLYRQRYVFSTNNSTAIAMNFASNDYLDIAQDKRVIKAFVTGAKRYGVGGMSSQLVSGYRDIHQEVELAFADFLKRDKALLFSCGYMANIGVISALANAYDNILLDKYAHASLIDGAKLSGIAWQRFQHQNYQHLQKLINKNPDKRHLMITDSVFSILGDIADLPQCTQICSDILVDDAHGIGVLGKNGAGALEHFALSQNDVPVLVCPLGKAFGVMGAIVAGSEQLIDYLVQFARSYTYTHAIPPALATAVLTSLSIIRKESWRREKLKALVQYCKQQAHSLGLKLAASQTPIQTIIIGNSAVTQRLHEILLQQAITVAAMRPPSVPEKFSGLRISLSCRHNEKQINKLLELVKVNYEHSLSNHR